MKPAARVSHPRVFWMHCKLAQKRSQRDCGHHIASEWKKLGAASFLGGWFHLSCINTAQHQRQEQAAAAEQPLAGARRAGEAPPFPCWSLNLPMTSNSPSSPSGTAWAGSLGGAAAPGPAGHLPQDAQTSAAHGGGTGSPPASSPASSPGSTVVTKNTEKAFIIEGRIP